MVAFAWLSLKEQLMIHRQINYTKTHMASRIRQEDIEEETRRQESAKKNYSKKYQWHQESAKKKYSKKTNGVKNLPRRNCRRSNPAQE